ncbi:MAG: phosphoribosylformylglycinamidine cyclo-ligase [Terriglobales bacterium]
MPISYAAAGVDIPAGNRAKTRIKRLARASFNRNVLAEIGGFGGLYRLPAGYRRPVLVSSVDGVGTKLKLAFQTGIHNTVGRDLVNHCVNDILVQGAQPLFFLDYLAVGKMNPDTVADVVEGISRACRENGCALIGGETAEMPGFYPPGEYDLAGTIVGLVEESAILTGAGIRPGDRLLGLRSAGLHTNGYSLARHLLFETAKYKPTTRLKELGMTLAEALLTEHRTYLPLLRPLLARGKRPGALRGMAHITGGGLTENLPRILPSDCAAVIDSRAWEIPALFRLLQDIGAVAPAEMRRTFNLGVGMVLVVAPDRLRHVTTHLRHQGEDVIALGEIVAGRRRVIYR